MSETWKPDAVLAKEREDKARGKAEDKAPRKPKQPAGRSDG